MMSMLLATVNPLEHVVQHPLIEIGAPTTILTPRGVMTLLSNHMIMQIIAALLLVLIIPRALRKRGGGDEVGRLVPRGFGNAIEGLCALLRKHVAEPALGPHTDRFIPYIWSAFFFILTSNLLGLIPLAGWTKPFAGHALGGTSTGNLWVTGTLAALTLIMIVVNGLRMNGMAYVRHFFMGPVPINVLIAGLEVIGLLAKTFALCMRLFANMVAGHILLAVLLSFIGMAITGVGLAGGLLISLCIVVGGVFINLLELFVAFLQAFIFTFLTTMFIGQAVIIHHEHQHDERHEEVAARVQG